MQPLRFHAREADPQTGLYYVRARWYDPELARFVSEDPLGLEGGLNPYVFAGNSPVNGRDPSGLQPEYPGVISLPGLVAVGVARDWAAFLRQLSTSASGRGYGPGSFGPGTGGGPRGGGSGGADGIGQVRENGKHILNLGYSPDLPKCLSRRYLSRFGVSPKR